MQVTVVDLPGRQIAAGGEGEQHGASMAWRRLAAQPTSGVAEHSEGGA
jgi:hypothetical protein